MSGMYGCSNTEMRHTTLVHRPITEPARALGGGGGEGEGEQVRL